MQKKDEKLDGKEEGNKEREKKEDCELWVCEAIYLKEPTEQNKNSVQVLNNIERMKKSISLAENRQYIYNGKDNILLREMKVKIVWSI